MKSTIHLLIMGICLLLATACGSETTEQSDQATAPKKAEITYTKATFSDLAKGKIKINTPVEMGGYMSASHWFSMNQFRRHYLFQYRRNQFKEIGIGLRMKIGNEPGKALPVSEPYKIKDFIIIDRDSQQVRVGDYAIFKGKYLGITGDVMNVDLDEIIKSEKAFDESVLNAARHLDEKLMNDTTFQSGFVYMDGQLSLPSTVLMMSGRGGYPFKTKDNSIVETAYFRSGNDPGAIAPMPNFYSKENFFVYDIHGEKHPANDKFRLYGHFRKFEKKHYDLKVNGIFNVEEVVKL